MATLKQRLHRKSNSGTYDVVHLETYSDIVDFDGQTVHDALSSALSLANAANQEIAGNNYITEKLLDQIIYDMQPMSTLAENDLAMSASGASATINSIMEANPQMTKDQAIQLYKDLYKQQYRGADILKGGSLYEKMSYVKNMDTNIYASENIPEAIGNIALTKSYLSKISHILI